MNNFKVNFDMYFLCTIMLGWIFFTWFEFLLKSINENAGTQAILISIAYMVVLGTAIAASAIRKPLFLVATSATSFLLLTAFMLGGDYWWFWTDVNVGLSILCFLISIVLLRQIDGEVTHTDS